jgi:hypothetical protein
MQPEPQPTTNPQEITTTPTAPVKLPWSKPRFWRIDDAGPDTGKLLLSYESTAPYYWYGPS